VELLKEGGTVIGIGEDIAFEEGQARLFSGDRLFVYTDGITEYHAGDGKFYDEARFYASLQEGKDESLQKQVADSIQAMMTFGRHQPPEDDVSLLGVAFAGTN
jgi:sigma-B regulation protein RsbU (phosphoserine phosphatase)